MLFRAAASGVGEHDKRYVHRRRSTLPCWTGREQVLLQAAHSKL